MKALHAGYVSSAVLDVIYKKKLSAELNWLDILSDLSHFVINQDIGEDGVLSPEMAILDNILTRGLPTLPSLFVERELERGTELSHFDVAGNNELSAFSCEINHAKIDAVLPLLERAFCIAAMDSKLEPSAGFNFQGMDSDSSIENFESGAEKEFWDGPLTQLLGPGGMQLALRQRLLSTIIEQGFVDQRADFSIQLPGGLEKPLVKGILFEVDGPSHQTMLSRKGDDVRDSSLIKSSWASTYRQSMWKGVKASDVIDEKHRGVQAAVRHPYLKRINQNISEPLSSTKIGQQVRSFALLPFAVARIQKVMIELVRGGHLDLNAQAWHLTVIDTDGLTGCGRIAAQDFTLWLSKLWSIYQPEKKVPDIFVHEISQKNSGLPLPEKCDILIDVSIELRYGASSHYSPDISAFNGAKLVTIRSDYFKSEPYQALRFEGLVLPKIEGDALEDALTFFLQNIFRKTAFRPKQFEIIKRALKGESVVGLLPTGAGKSITYQLPTLLQNGMAIIVDPIKSLMKDQVDNLQAIGIQVSAFINSMTNASERRKNTKLMQQGCFKFVFVSPERFIIQEFRDALERMRSEGKVHFAYIVVDEAHCVSEWGHDFRTAYLRLGSNSRHFCWSRWPKVPILALTGTASQDVLEDIHTELGFSDEENFTVKPDSMERKNLKFKVVGLDHQPEIPKNMPDQKFRQLLGQAKLDQVPVIVSNIANMIGSDGFSSFITSNQGSGLIFCPHARGLHGADAIRMALSNTFESIKDRLGVYYGSPDESKIGLDAFDPIKTQNEFKDGALKVLACTKAFGMGIDKPDIRFTLHFNIPPSIESFYQEAGRAGRDGDVAQCWILYAGTKNDKSEQSIDYSLNYSFHASTFPGCDVEEAQVLELLDQNRVPGDSIESDIENLLLDETGISFTVKPWQRAQDDIYRLYVNHPDHPDLKAFISIPRTGKLGASTTATFPEWDNVANLILTWLNASRPNGIDWREWLSQSKSMSIEPGLEELINNLKVNRSQRVCLSLDNGYLDEMSIRAGLSIQDIKSAYRFVDGEDDLIAKLKIKDSEIESWIRSAFPKIRLAQQTHRAIYRLTVLGAVDDFIVDYSSSTLTASIVHLPEGKYRDNLLNYIDRYAPLEVERYLRIADLSTYPTELRRCLHSLIQFVYDRIANQRKRALINIEQATLKGLDDESSFLDTVVNYFDSPYLDVLKPYSKFYESENPVFDVCIEIAANSTKLAQLLGACNRLLEESPNNGVFHALRAYAIAHLDYQDKDIKAELDEALACFERDFFWGRKEKLDFLVRLREMIPNEKFATVFDAEIVNDHARWLRKINAQPATWEHYEYDLS